MSTGSSRFRLPGPGWARAVTAGMLVTVAVTVLTVSVIAAGRGGAADGDTSTPRADGEPSSTARPRGEGGVDDRSESKQPSGNPEAETGNDGGDGDDGGSGGGDKAKYPGSGTYRIRSAVGGYCVGVGSEGGTGKDVFVLDDCGSASPATRLVKTGTHTYQVKVYDPGKGTGCMAVDPPGDGDGFLAVPTECTGSDLQSFTLERSNGGFQIVVDGTGKCVAPLGGEARRDQPLATLGCVGGEVETFGFE